MADLGGRTIAFLEGRRATELADLITRHNGVPLAAPCLREVHQPGSPVLQGSIQRVLDAAPAVLIFMTGVGTTTVFDVASGSFELAMRCAAWLLAPLISRAAVSGSTPGTTTSSCCSLVR